MVQTGNTLPARAPLLPRRHIDDYEFLAPALEILESPPSPVRMAMILVIAALVAAAVAWAYLGRIDIVATAQGKVQPVGRVKVVQPLETGRIARIAAANGARVRAGDTLIELDSMAAMAEVQSAELGQLSARAEVIRRTAAVSAARLRSSEPVPPITWPAAVPPLLQAREDKVYLADLSQLRTAASVLALQQAQKQAELDQLGQTMATQNDLIATLKQRVDMKVRLIELNAGTRAGLIDATEALQSQITQLAVQKGQAVSAEKAIRVLAEQQGKAYDDFVSDNAQKGSEAERRADDLEQALAKARAARDHLTLTAPIDGTVQASTAINAGQVLGSGQEVMRIVPNGTLLEVEVYVQNRDIGMIRVGQDAVVKVEAFPFTRYGVIAAHVTHVAEDAIPEPDAREIEGDPARASANAGYAGAQRTQNLVFPVRLALDANAIAVDGHPVPLTSGMTVNADLKTGRRRILEYLFSPVLEVSSQAMRER